VGDRDGRCVSDDVNVIVLLGDIEVVIVIVPLTEIVCDIVPVCVGVSLDDFLTEYVGDAVCQIVGVDVLVMVRLRLIVDDVVGVRVARGDADTEGDRTGDRVTILDREAVRVTGCVRVVRAVAVALTGGARVLEGRAEEDPEDDARVERVLNDEAVVVRVDELVCVLVGDGVFVRVGTVVREIRELDVDVGEIRDV
jgi:hypothetical protein